MNLRLGIFICLAVLSVEIGMLAAILTSHPEPEAENLILVVNDRPVLTQEQKEELEENGRVGIDRGDGHIWIVTEEQ